MDDLKIIKKKYGEKMMHLCRELFPSLLETPGLLSSIMLEHFESSKLLYDDLIENSKEDDFKNYVYSFVDVEKENKLVIDKTPQELLSEAGYILYECKTEEEIQAFKKFYAPGEELCTFRGNRLDTCFVYFAVKKNVAEIRRENFNQPRREDEYGTSVISIQFRKKTPNTLSIKNRYNHSVNNPDSTFSNNLDNIIPGLTESFRRKYGYEFAFDNNNFEIPGYVNVNGKYYKYNYEINNIYYCPNNIIIDNYTVIDKYSKEPERYIVMDYFVIDLKLKTIKLYDSRMVDSFIGDFKNIENIIVSKDKVSGNKTLEIVYDGEKKAVMVISKANQIIEYHNNNLTEMSDRNLSKITKLETLDVPNVLTIGDECLRQVDNLTTVNLYNLTKIGYDSLSDINGLRSMVVPNLTEIGNYSMSGVLYLEEFIAPSLRKTGIGCMTNPESLRELDLPNLMQVGSSFLSGSWSLIRFSAPNLVELPNNCLHDAQNLVSINIPNLVTMGSGCLSEARKLISFVAPKLVTMGDSCLFLAHNLQEFIAPNLSKKGKDSLKYASSIIRYKDAKQEYEKEFMEVEEIIQDEAITKTGKISQALLKKLNKILKNNVHKIKEFKKKILEGTMRK